MKTHYFNQEKPDDDDIMLQLVKQQGYVSSNCLLNGNHVMALINEQKDPCEGCQCDREKCKGRDNHRNLDLHPLSRR